MYRYSILNNIYKIYGRLSKLIFNKIIYFEECPPGTHGKNCSKLCTDGFYGKKCMRKCPSKCNKTCKKGSGVCPGPQQGDILLLFN